MKKEIIKQYIREHLFEADIAPEFDLDSPKTQHEEQMDQLFDLLANFEEILDKTRSVKSKLDNNYHSVESSDKSDPETVSELQTLEKVLVKLQKSEKLLGNLVYFWRDYQ